MTELDPQPGGDVTARLLEQLTRTNDRLERLEAALRERSLLPGLQQEPPHGDVDKPPITSGGVTAREGGATTAGSAPPDPALEAEPHFRRGVEFCQMGKFDEAVAAWREVLRIQPNNPYALANTGIVFTEQARWPEARDMFMRALAVQPDNAEAHYGLGMADAQLGNYAGAIAAWENTLRLQPDNSDARYNLALVRQRLIRDHGSRPAASPAGSAAGASGPTAPGARPAAARQIGLKAGDATRQADAAENRGPFASGEIDSAGPREAAAEAAEHRGKERILPESAAATTWQPRPRAGAVAALAVAIVVVATVASILLYNNYIVSRSHGAPRIETPAVPSPPAANGSTPKTLPPIASRAIDPVPTVHVEPSADPEAGALAAQAAQGPAHSGTMKIRLASGLSGSFRYWFVSISDQAARIRPLPGAARNGIIALPIPAEFNRPGAQLRILNVKQGKVARVSVMDVTQPTVIVSPNVGPNLLQNADFAQGAKGWSLETTAPGRATMRIQDGFSAPPGVTGRAVHFDVAAIGSQGWNVQCYQSGVDLKEGQPYLLSCWARSDRDRPLHLDIILDRPDWHKVGVTTSVNVTSQWHKHLFHFTPTRTQPAHSRVSFVLGEALGPVDVAGITLRRSNGADTSVTTTANSSVTILASDFN